MHREIRIPQWFGLGGEKNARRLRAKCDPNTSYLANPNLCRLPFSLADRKEPSGSSARRRTASLTVSEATFIPARTAGSTAAIIAEAPLEER
jgi:hypothetical protein